MAQQSREQKETVERVMHEFKHGDLETGQGRKVKDSKQAIAIALREAGASRNASKQKNREALKRTKRRERSDAAEAGEGSDEGESRAALYAEARRRNIPGRSKMSKDDLKQALHRS
ncbi:DUF6496 domain-containing protein [Azospirillum thermophilum]|uniref:Plasmid stabilization protein n=1 Tax=Azospirillum thermophilum TaxID=2202148 RepID=A0A2S2CW65_9PROT|nr:DUF6496 domain-containing protein [Azospirillum thermophilum]AWK88655.1 hypothetical protein DEW08_21375 [Azospirillum thermophilum]